MLSADEMREVIELKALVSVDDQCLVVMFPRGKNKQLTARTGIHTCSARLSKVSKFVALSTQ